MNYSVNWLPNAEQELAALWLNSSDRDAITSASSVIDQLLVRDPDNEGESRPNGRRIVFATPLAAIYRIHPDKRQVDVLHVWKFRTSRG
jgi:plasmid stabilization system protein ParE